ncbi:MAG TPA: potassium channel family protein [Acidobacteriaceae bacterium]|nr:potassium channel family protein [Acidobacteriaceae bacterium]
MRFATLIGGVVLLAVVLLDAFQSIILPRRPVGRLRITRLFFLTTWHPWTTLVGILRSRAGREQAYSVYGPLSLLVLFVFWAVLLSVGYGLVFFGLHVGFHDPLLVNANRWARLRSCLYVSGTTLFTLGLGDVTPETPISRVFIVLEAGTGLGFVALVIGYVPVLYTAFSHREVQVALLDARAGSPPTAAELLLRHSFDEGPDVLRRLLADWEVWCAEMLETHISYPILCYYRSQHDNQSWLAALTAVLDTCSVLITMLEGEKTRQAQLTFAIGRHTLVDLVHVFHLEPEEKHLREMPLTRLPDEELMRLCEALEGTGFSPCEDFESRERLLAMRLLYEPYACALANYLKLNLPQWVPPPAQVRKNDAWTVVAGLRSPQVLAGRLTRHVSGQSTAVNLESHDEDERRL